MSPKDHATYKTKGHQASARMLQESITHGLFGVGECMVLEGFRAANPGQKLAVLRQLQGLTQTTLAEQAGVRQADVSHAENAFHQCKLDALQKITAVLGIPLQSLLARETYGEPANESLNV